MSEVEWPVDFERTPASERTRNRSFEVTLSKAFDDLEAELDRLGVDDHRYSFDAQQRQRDNRPYARASPDDPSFVLRWTMDGDQYAIGCDAYSRLRDNVRTVGLYVREKRKMEGRPVATGESEFANARLPPGDEDAIAMGDGSPSRQEPHDVLNVAPDADEAVVKAAARQLKKKHHPDQGGDVEQFKQIVAAEEVMLDAAE